MGDFDINEIKKDVTPRKKKKRRSTKKRLTNITLVCLGLIFLVSGLIVYEFKYANDPNELTIGYSTEETFTLVSISESRGAFSEKSIPTEYRKFKNDQEVLEALNKKRIDVAVVEDVEYAVTLPPLVGQKVLATISSSNSYFFVLDVKKGLLGKEDLINRELGVADTLGADYWLSKSLSNRREVKTKSLRPDKLPVEFANAKIDGVFAKQPYIYQVENFERTGVQSLLIDGQSGRRSHTMLIVNEEFLYQNEQDLKDFLEVLYDTEIYYQEFREDIEEQLIPLWGAERRYVRTIIENYDYELSLNPDVRSTFQTQYDWGRQRNRRSSQSDFMFESIFYYSLLRDTKPEGVEF